MPALNAEQVEALKLVYTLTDEEIASMDQQVALALANRAIERKKTDEKHKP